MNDRQLKPAVCILNPDDVYNMKANFANDSYYCITPYEAVDMQNQGISFPVDPHIQEGLVLTRNPDGDGYYYRTDESDGRIINERCLAIEAILSYLGGKEFRYSESSSFKSNLSSGITVDVNAKRWCNSIDNTTQENKSTSEQECKDKAVAAQWSGNYTHAGYLRAVELAKSNGLISDPTIAALLEQRLPSHPNPIAAQEYHVNITSDLDNNIHILEDLSINIANKIGVGLKVDLNSSRKLDSSSTVDFFVSFGPIPQEVSKMAQEKEEARLLHNEKKGFKWLWVVTAAIVIIGALVIALS